MIKVLTWNIQCGLGMDGRIDLRRIADVILRMGDFDVICLQEVSRFDASVTGDSSEADQAHAIGNLFNGYGAFFGAAIDRLNADGKTRRQFGNMILSRLPVIQTFNFQLPQPIPEAPCKHMPRQAIEVAVAAHGEPIRITTTHLEYHTQAQRLAQAEALRNIQSNVVANIDYAAHAPASGPYAAVPRPVSSILCGDFNSAPHDAVFDVLIAADGEGDGYRDAWEVANVSQPHAPTCGIFDHKQWPQGPHCRDFFFISDTLAERNIQVSVDTETDASDHQPVMLSVD